MITKNEIDKLAQRYETKEFFNDDPVRFPNKFTDKKDIEIAGFHCFFGCLRQKRSIC